MNQPVEDDFLSHEPHEAAEELPTNRLSSGKLVLLSSRAGTLEEQAGTDGEQSQTDRKVDWLGKLKSQPLSTQMLPENIGNEEPTAGGISRHAAPARMVPTRGARFTTSLRHGTLMLITGALALGVLVAAGYALTTTQWFSPPPAVQPSSPGKGISPSSNVSPGQAQPGQPAGPVGKGSTGTDARQLRDQGVEQYKKGNFSAAAQLLESYLLAGGNDSVAYYQLGLCYTAMTGRPHSLEDAELAFRTATSLQPTWAAPQQGLAESLIRQGYYVAAIAPALKATQLDPKMAEAWMTLSRAYKGAGHEAEATRAFAEATRLSPDPPSRP
ncbi:MAG: hypothetical protein M3014_05420 [Chloroflexota bacterium]|nr:hypothetical protein [Chloroflexota bacterium]